MANLKYVWLAEHDDCFGGYKIQCVARTKEEAKAKVLERWIEVYKTWKMPKNCKCDPDEYEIACAADCISVTKMELGVPEGI